MTEPTAEPPRISDDPTLDGGLRELLLAGRDDLLEPPAVSRVGEGVRRDTASTASSPLSTGAKLALGLGAVAVVVLVYALGSPARESTVNRPGAEAAPVEVVAPPEVPPLREAAPVATPPAVAPAPMRSQDPVPPPSARAAARSAASDKRAEPQKDADDEGVLLLAARRALSTDPARALALTQQHEREFERGALAAERELIAIRALHALARDDAALRRAQAFRRAYPDSPHRVAVDRIVADLTEGGG